MTGNSEATLGYLLAAHIAALHALPVTLGTARSQASPLDTAGTPDPNQHKLATGAARSIPPDVAIAANASDSEDEDEIQLLQPAQPTRMHRKPAARVTPPAVLRLSPSREDVSPARPPMRAAERNHSSNPARAHPVQYDLKVQVPSARNPVEALVASVQVELAELRSYDVLYPWPTNAAGVSAITDFSRLPVRLGDLRAYFPRVTIRGRATNGLHPGGQQYVSLWLGHSTEFKKLQEDFGSWFDSHNCALYRKLVQVDETKTIGWLLYSLLEMDPKEMMSLLDSEYGLTVGVCWRIINVGCRHNTNTAGRKSAEGTKEITVVRALHLEVAAADFEQRQTHLQRIYSS